MKCSLAENEDGATAVEFALIALPLFMFLFGIVEFSRYFYTYNNLERTADQLARFTMVRHGKLAVNQANYQRDIRQWMTDNYRFDDPSGVQVSTAVGEKNGLNYREFTLQKSVTLFIPMIDISTDIVVTRQVPY